MLKKKDKSLDHNKSGDEVTKLHPCHFWLYKATLHELRQDPKRVKDLCEAVRQFGYEPRARDMEQFCLEYKLAPIKFKEWRRELPDLNEAALEMKEAIHVRRRMAWGDRHLADANFLRYAHLHSTEEKELNDYHDARKKDAIQEQGIVFIRDVPSIITGKIAPRKEPESVPE